MVRHLLPRVLTNSFTIPGTFNGGDTLSSRWRTWDDYIQATGQCLGW